jgi:predicted dehydrogenase
METFGRREFFKSAAGGAIVSAGAMAAMEMAFASSPAGAAETVMAPDNAAALPTHHIKFAVVGVSHPHIYGMTDAVLRGGGELIAVQAGEPENGATFVKKYPQARLVQTEDEILNDKSIQLVLSATIPDGRAPLGIRVMKHGKDYLSDKPGATTLEQLAEIRKTVAETKQIYAIMYSERLEVRAAVHAGELVQAGAIGKVVQTINIAPHRVNPSSRPAWFWDRPRYGGILCDIGSHQVDQFLYYTGSTKADVVAAQVGNVRHRDHPSFQDFGDLMLSGNRGVGYVRVDWYTPDGLSTWGDGRLFILGTDGYIELRKYVDIAGREGGNHLFIADQKQVQYIDCGKMTLPFGPQFVADIVNRTHVAQDQEQCLLAAELVLKAQLQARTLELDA